jgi:hypothetical protein
MEIMEIPRELPRLENRRNLRVVRLNGLLYSNEQATPIR